MPIAKFQEQGGRLQTDDLDFGAFERQPLSPEVLRCIEYMHDIEYHTVCYTRELLVTKAWKDPDVTAFITLWNYEEYWHGEALGRVLERHGRTAHTPRLAEMRRADRRYLQWSPAIFWTMAHVMRSFPAVHMTWGAINEWTANVAYNRLATLADHPVLSELLGRIMRQEGRHAGYYSSYARDLLVDDPKARKVVRWMLEHQWEVVGSGDVPRVETAFVTDYLFGGNEGHPHLVRIDERIDSLPGQAGLGLMRRAVGGARRDLDAMASGTHKSPSALARLMPRVAAAS
jgi:hypothetical protein